MSSEIALFSPVRKLVSVQMIIRGRWETIPAYRAIDADVAVMVVAELSKGSNGAIQYRVR